MPSWVRLQRANARSKRTSSMDPTTRTRSSSATPTPTRWTTVYQSGCQCLPIRLSQVRRIPRSLPLHRLLQRLTSLTRTTTTSTTLHHLATSPPHHTRRSLPLRRMLVRRSRFPTHRHAASPMAQASRTCSLKRLWLPPQSLSSPVHLLLSLVVLLSHPSKVLRHLVNAAVESTPSATRSSLNLLLSSKLLMVSSPLYPTIKLVVLVLPSWALPVLSTPLRLRLGLIQRKLFLPHRFRNTNPHPDHSRCLLRLPHPAHLQLRLQHHLTSLRLHRI